MALVDKVLRKQGIAYWADTIWNCFHFYIVFPFGKMAFCVEQNINKTYICSACRQTIQMANQRLALFAFGNLKLQFSPPSQPYQTAEAERILLYFCQGSRIGGNFNLPKDLFFLLSMLRGFGEMGLRGTRLLALLKHSNSNLPVLNFLQTSRNTTFQWMMNASQSP